MANKSIFFINLILSFLCVVYASFRPMGLTSFFLCGVLDMEDGMRYNGFVSPLPFDSVIVPRDGMYVNRRAYKIKMYFGRRVYEQCTAWQDHQSHV